MTLIPICSLMLISFTVTGQPSASRNWVDTDIMYTDSAGNAVKIQSSLPKGGGTYTDSAGRKYGYVIFWNRIVNESKKPLELTLEFPADPYYIFSSPDSYIRIFLPPDTMNLGKISMIDYGLTDLKSYLDAEFDKPSRLTQAINPREESFCYIPILFHQAQGTTRTALVLEGEELFFKISVRPEVESVLIPCGQLVFKD